jgi:gluconokinase
MSYVVMGVSGCGKSSTGQHIASKLNLNFLDGDDYHPASNVAKMAGGTPLDDDDRLPWLTILGNELNCNERVVVACSALKKSYRDILRGGGGGEITFVYLKGSYEYFLARMEARENHYMKSGMLQGQFAALEEPEVGMEGDVVVVDVEGKSVEDITVAAIPQKS